MVWVEGVFRRIANPQPGGPTIVAAFRDISERRAQAEALRAAKEVAEAASEAKTDFLASMSHEIRTPLNAVLGYADLMLADASLQAGQRLHLGHIQTAGSALLTVVNLLRIDTGMWLFAPPAGRWERPREPRRDQARKDTHGLG